MTEEQKTKICEMYQMGYPYKDIAHALSIAPGTIKSYCYRAIKRGLLSVPQSPKDNLLCKQCGKPIVQTPKRKKKIFCCGECRQKWWNAHLYLAKKSSKALYHFICPNCKKPFTAYGNKDRKYCSHTCYIDSRYHSEAHHDS